MYRVLMVEDDELSVRYFQKTLHAEMPDAKLVEASSIPQAEQIIDDTVAKGASFDAVVLDCNLPSQEGVFEMNTSLCHLVTLKFSEALVAHCSAYTENPALKRHILEAHAPWPSPRGCVVPKGENWDTTLVRTLATDRVERGLSDFFHSGAGLPAGRSGEGRATVRLAQLTAAIARFWKFLPEQTRQRILRDFHVTEDGKTVRVKMDGDQ